MEERVEYGRYYSGGFLAMEFGEGVVKKGVGGG